MIDGFPWDESPKAGWPRGVEEIWMIGKERTLLCFAAVLVEFLEELANAREGAER